MLSLSYRRATESFFKLVQFCSSIVSETSSDFLHTHSLISTSINLRNNGFHDLVSRSEFFTLFFTTLPNLIYKFSDLKTLGGVEFFLSLVHLFEQALS